MQFIRLPSIPGSDPTRQMYINPEVVGMLVPTRTDVRGNAVPTTRILFVGGGEVTVFLKLEEIIAAIDAAHKEEKP